MPIGSPAFMANFMVHWTLQGEFDRPELMFAHSNRIVEELEDGSKKVSFKFEQWIYLA